MSLIPEDTYSTKAQINFAPMVDFLFLIVTAFAVLAVSRSALFDSRIFLPNTPESTETTQNAGRSLNVTIHASGAYSLLTEKGSSTATLPELKQTLQLLKHQNGPFPIYLHIDKRASWEGVARLIQAAKQENLATYPVYKSDQ